MTSLEPKSNNPVAILEELNRLPTSELLLNNDARQQALSLSQKLSRSLEDPVSYATQVVFTPFPSIAARMAVDLDLFSHLVAHGQETSVSTSKLAEVSGGEEQLVSRILRMLASIGLLAQPSEDHWAPTAVSEAMASPTVSAGHRYIFDMLVSAGVRGPKFLRENGFTAPVEPHDGFVQYANQTKLDIFGFMQTMPALMGDFNTFMGHQKGKKAYWYDWSSVDEILFKDFDATKSVLMVDIGGGRGHDLQAFHSRFPGRGQLILQDLPQVITSIDADELDPSIQRQVYDHFSIQHVTGARAYFLHRILHQWSDKYCLEILSNTRRAMSPGYSKLLINELVLPNVGASTYQCTFDIAMMAANGGIERSQQQWTTLLEQAGFKDIKFWTKANIGDGLIEARI